MEEGHALWLRAGVLGHVSDSTPLIYGPACFSHSFTLHVLARVWSRCCKGCCFAFLSSTRRVSLTFKLQLTRVSASVVFAGVVRTRVSRARFVLTHMAWLSAVSGGAVHEHRQRTNTYSCTPTALVSFHCIARSLPDTLLWAPVLCRHFVALILSVSWLGRCCGRLFPATWHKQLQVQV